jgi:hypothetical protein
VIVPYTELPTSAGGSPRPLLDLVIADMDDILVPCLVDSGALNTLLPAWIAEAAGITTKDASMKRLGVAGSSTEAAFVTTMLSVGGHSWEADVGFCDPWPYGWGLLGHLSFFRFFTVVFRAVDLEFELEPVTN